MIVDHVVLAWLYSVMFLQLETHFTTVNSYVMNMFRVSCPDVSRSSTKLRFDVPRPPAKLRFNPPTKLRFDPTTKLRFDDMSGSPTKLRFDVSGPPTQLRFDDVSGPPTKLLFDDVSEPPTNTRFDESGPPAKLRFDVSRLPGPAKICLTEPRSLTRIVALAEVSECENGHPLLMYVIIGVKLELHACPLYCMENDQLWDIVRGSMT